MGCLLCQRCSGGDGRTGAAKSQALQPGDARGLLPDTQSRVGKGNKAGSFKRVFRRLAAPPGQPILTVPTHGGSRDSAGGGGHRRDRGTNTGADNGTEPVLPPRRPPRPSPAQPSPTEGWGAHPGWGPAGAALSPGSGTERRPPPVLLPRGPSVRTGGCGRSASPRASPLCPQGGGGERRRRRCGRARSGGGCGERSPSSYR